MERLVILPHFHPREERMRRPSILVALLLAALEPSTAAAELSVTTPVIDLGVIRGGQKAAHQFELTNSSTQAIEILDLQRGCGCLAPRLDQRVIPAGGKTSLAVELRTLGQSDGPHAWNLQVHYRVGKDTKSLPLTLRGTVKNDITVQPAILGLHVTKTVEQEITLTDFRAMPLRVVDAEARGAGVRMTGIERAGKITKLRVSADAAQLAPGRHEGRLTITTDDPDYGQLQVPIVVTRATAQTVRATPEQAVLRLAPGSTSASTLVRLRAAGDEKVSVAKIEPGDPVLVCTWASGPGNDAMLKIQARTSIQSHIEVHLATPAKEVLTIPVVVQ
jgi:hypothetical protein